jgi:hypothetical protein
VIGLSKVLQNMSMARSAIVIAIFLIAAFLIALMPSAEARGGGGHGTHSAEFAGGHRHGNDSHVKAASEERQRLLDTQLKSICRGC